MLKLNADIVRKKILEDVKKRVDKFKELKKRSPKLNVILVGDHTPSKIYISKKTKLAKSIGIKSDTLVFKDDISFNEIIEKINKLNNDPLIDGILIQRPLPKVLLNKNPSTWINPDKDVDGFHPLNVGKLSLGLPCLKPCTPHGIIKLLEHYKIPLEGKLACIIGRSEIVGKPMQVMLLNKNVTVIHCHSKTKDLINLSSMSDIVIASIGKKHFINKEFIKKGAIVIDVGIHRDSNNKITGDVDYDSISEKASGASPTPGGVGIMTVSTLLENTILAAELREGIY